MSLRRVALLFLVTLSCQAQSVAPRSRFVEDGVVKGAVEPWKAERIEVDNTGVTAGGGLELSAPGTDRVVATARFLALADTYDKQSADEAIVSAKRSFVVTTAADVTVVRCGRGLQIKSATESGCDALDVAVPTGAADKPLTLVARSGNGSVRVALSGVSLAVLDLRASHGSIDATTPAPPGASLSIASETGDLVTLRLPRDFAADELVLDAPPGAVDTSAFPDVQAGKGRGEPGRGPRTITVRAGRIVLAAQP